MINHHAALIYTMVLASAADGDMTDTELRRIGDIVGHLPIFRDFDIEDLPGAAANAADILSGDDGLETAFTIIRQALPGHLPETAYALACDVVAADGEINQEELRLLELLRHGLEVSRLVAAAIERAAAARYAIL